MLELEAVRRGDAGAATGWRRPRGIVALSAALVAVAFASAVVSHVGFGRTGASDDSTVRLTFSPPDGLRVADLVNGGAVTISPDGERLAFVATDREGTQRIWVRALGSASAQALQGTDGGAHPFWAPDSRSIGFFAQRKLKIVRLAGGSPQVLCDAVLPRGGAWNGDGVIVFSAGAGRQLYRVSAAGGTVSAIPADAWNPERHWPVFLPGGRHFVYFGRPQKHGIYVAALDGPRGTLLLADHVGIAYAPPGYLLALRGPSRGAPAGALLAYPFDAARLQITGDATAVADRVRYESGLARGAFTVSDNGTLVYGDIDQSPTQLVWFDRRGKTLGNAGGSFAFGQPSFSPDEKTIAVEHVDPITQDQDLWLIDVARNIASRFTSEGDNITFMPIWSPDGRRLVFASARGTPPNLYQKAAGASSDELLLKSPSNNQPTDWSRDGQFVIYAGMDPATQWDLWIVPMSSDATDRTPVPLLQTEFNEHLGRISPDGRWLAYASDESGRNEVYVQPLRGPGPKRRVSAGGGSEPKWRADGRELFYLAADGTMMVAPVHSEPGLAVERAVPLFKVRLGPTRNFGYDVNYSVTHDGQRFVIRTLADESEYIPPATVVLNWPAGLAPR
jgi:Tol biopolymer transport system component